jgi:hypothetical protein
MKIYISSLTGRAIFCLLLLTLPMLVFCQYSYSGIVYNKYTGQTIPGVNIRVTNLDSNNKLIANSSTNSDGRYSFSMGFNFNIRITATRDGFKKSETTYTPAQLNLINQTESSLSPIYLDTTLKFVFEPDKPVRQSRDQYAVSKLESIMIVPTPAAYNLLYYLNPDLQFKDSLMSNDKLVLPVMPVLSNEITNANKEVFRDLERKDRQAQNHSRDAADQLIRILADDIRNYEIKYDGADRDRLILMREYLKIDVENYKRGIVNTPKLKAETLIQLMSTLSYEHENIVTKLFINGPDYENLRILWEDLSYVISSSLYQNFINRNRRKTQPGLLRAVKGHPGPSISGDEEFSAPELNLYPAVTDERLVPKPFVDETAFFGFLIWSPELTPRGKPDLTEPSMRYVVRYFIWAYRNNKDAYNQSMGNANTALANLTRGRYGVEVYDTYEKKIVETIFPYFTTDAALDDRQLDNFLIPDFKEVKFILIQLK